MRLPSRIVIDPRKIKDYLLVFKRDKDKSKFLSLGGYVENNWQELLKDIYELSQNDAEYQGKSGWGENEYSIYGILSGRNNGKQLEVNLIFHSFEEESRFITLIPIGVVQ